MSLWWGGVCFNEGGVLLCGYYLIIFVMRDVSSKLLLAAAFSVVLLGAGCSTKTTGTATTPTETTTTTTTKTDAGTTKTTTTTKAALVCPSGTTSFVAAKLNLEFCYPTVDDGGTKITVAEKADGAVLSVGGVATRKVAVVNVPAGETAVDYIKATYVNAKVPTGTICSVDSAAWGTTKAVQYNISGLDLDSSDACNDNGLYAGLLEHLGGAIFISYPSAPTTLYVLSGEQDALLGFKHTDDFQNSIQPKN